MFPHAKMIVMEMVIALMEIANVRMDLRGKLALKHVIIPFHNFYFFLFFSFLLIFSFFFYRLFPLICHFYSSLLHIDCRETSEGEHCGGESRGKCDTISSSLLFLTLFLFVPSPPSNPLFSLIIRNRKTMQMQPRILWW